MLTLYHNGQQLPIQDTEYYVRELASGLDEVIFNLSIYDPIYAALQEEEQITDRGGQRYLVKQIDAGADSAKVICQIDLDDWKSAMYVNYDSGSKRVALQIDAIKPAGWRVIDLSGSTISRTLHGDFTALQIAQECCKVYSVYLRWNNALKTVTIHRQAIGSPVGSFATRELNLVEINYKGKSTNFATRLYPYGKDDLTIEGATIDGATYTKAYVENHTYSSKVISVVWRDERYTDAQSLYDSAVANLAELAVPSRSYDCSIVDLQATNPDKYANLDFSLFTTATLIDDIKETAVNYMVVERHVYPYHPEENEVIFDSSPQKITTQVVQLQEYVEDELNEFLSIMDSEIQQATSWLTNADSHIYIKRDPDTGEWQELFFLDGTQDPALATRVMRLNSAGLGFSKNGVNGPFGNAFVFDNDLGGHLVADYITAGTLTANIIKAGVLSDINDNTSFDLATGELNITKGSINLGSGAFKVDSSGNVYIKDGEIYQEHYINATYGTAWLRIKSTEIQGGYTAYGNTAELDLQNTFTVNGQQMAAAALVNNRGDTYLQASRNIYLGSGGIYVGNANISSVTPGVTGTFTDTDSEGAHRYVIAEKGIVTYLGY